MTRFKFNNISSFVERECIRKGWDTETDQYEQCGYRFKESTCKCHPDYCVYCSSETHGEELMLPGLLEHSAVEGILEGMEEEVA